MSEFNYPIQIDSSKYIKTSQDISYNKIFNKIFKDTNIKSLLKKIRTHLKLGIENTLIDDTFYYVVLLDYFDSLFEYYKKASIVEKQNFYLKYIQCLETNSICRNDPKLIRYLSEVIKYNFNVECGLNYKDDISSYYLSENKTYNLNTINRNNYTEQFCMYYFTSTFNVYYYEYSFDDLDIRDTLYSYNFKNNTLINTGTGVHNFYFNRKVNRRISFLANFINTRTDLKVDKTISINIVSYISNSVNYDDVNNLVILGINDQMIAYKNKLMLFTVDIFYNQFTDLTAYLFTPTDLTNQLTEIII